MKELFHSYFFSTKKVFLTILSSVLLFNTLFMVILIGFCYFSMTFTVK